MGMRRGTSVFLVAFPVLVGCATGPDQAQDADSLPDVSGFPKDAWRGVHVLYQDRGDLAILRRAIEEVFVPKGVNALVLEVNYFFEWQSHPELRVPGGMTKDDAREFAAYCRGKGIRLIPQFNCFGHQSWAANTFPLLTHYAELDVSPEVPASNEGIYCRSWNPLHPKTNEIVFALLDELVDAFQPEAFHVGMDEVFLFPEEGDPHYQGETTAEVFAKTVNDLHAHLVKEKGLTMLIWGDRLIPMSEMNYGRYESSDNGTAPAIDLIPKDIIVCDWHYSRRAEYPSVPYFQDKGFRVWPAPWRSRTAALALMSYSQRTATDRMIGMLCTTWCGTTNFCKVILGESTEETPPLAVKVGETFDAVAAVW